MLKPLVVLLFLSFFNGISAREFHYHGVAWSHDGETIAVATPNAIWLFNGNSIEDEPHQLPLKDSVNVAFSPTDDLLAVTDSAGGITVWDMEQNEAILLLPAGNLDVEFSPDGTHLLATNISELRLWEVESGKQVSRVEFAPCEDDFYCSPVGAAFSPDGKAIATLSYKSDSEVLWQLWDAETGEEIQQQVGVFMGISLHSDIAFSPDGNSLIGGIDLGMWMWRLADNTLQQVEMVDELTDEIYDLGHQWGVSAVAFSPSGETFASGGYEDGTVQLYDATQAKEIAYFDGSVASIFGLAFSPDGARLAVVNEDGDFQILDGESGELLYSRRI